MSPEITQLWTHLHSFISTNNDSKLDQVIKTVLKHPSLELLFFTCINTPQSFSLLLHHISPLHSQPFAFSHPLVPLAINHRGYATVDTTLRTLHNSILIKKTTTASCADRPDRIQYNTMECNIREKKKATTVAATALMRQLSLLEAAIKTLLQHWDYCRDKEVYQKIV